MTRHLLTPSLLAVASRPCGYSHVRARASFCTTPAMRTLWWTRAGASVGVVPALASSTTMASLQIHRTQADLFSHCTESQLQGAAAADPRRERFPPSTAAGMRALRNSSDPVK